jgi:hypothetical protein
MNRFILMIVLIVTLTATVTSVTALDCSLVTSFAPDVCLFNPSQQLNFLDQTTPSTFCRDVNIDPFSAAAMTSNGAADRDRCNTAIRQDGNACIELYAMFVCSSTCELCLKDACKSFCDDIRTVCPGATAANCLTQLSPCSDSNTDCTDWDVDTSKLPSAIDTTTAATTKATGTTTATTTTTTGTGTTSSAWNVAAPCFVVLMISYVLHNAI